MPDRRRRKNPKRHQLCLRLTDRQKELLDAYSDMKSFESGVDAVRHMIDGLEDWLARQQSRRSISDAPAAHSSGGAHSGLPSTPSDVTRTDVDTDEAPSVADFGGRPAVGLPDASWNHGISDE